MTALRSLLGRAGERAIKADDYWGKWARGDDIDLGATTPAGVTVNRTTALSLSAVWASVTLISDAIASLPLDSYIRRDGARRPYRPRPGWIDAPNREQTRVQFLQQALMALLIDGTAYFLTPRDNRGEVIEVWNVHPDYVTPRRVDGRVVYDVRDPDRPGLGATLTEFDMFHVPAFSWPGDLEGISPLEAARRMIGAGLAAQEFAERYFGQGLHAAGVIEVEGELELEQARELKQDFQRLHGGLRRSHLPAVLTSGAKWRPLSVTPEQAQFLESRKFSVTEVARWYRVPPHLIGDVERSTSWGTGIEEQGIGFVTYTLRPWLEKLEQAFTKHLLPPPAFVKFNANGLLRGDFTRRMEGYATARQWGWMSADDIRALEDLPPLPDGAGEEYLVPVNMRPAGEPVGDETGDATDG